MQSRLSPQQETDTIRTATIRRTMLKKPKRTNSNNKSQASRGTLDFISAYCCLLLIVILVVFHQSQTVQVSLALQQSARVASLNLPPSADSADNGPLTKKCDENRHIEMDRCASSLGFLGDRSFIMPKNVTQMNGFCGTLTKSLKCIQNYARECLSSFPRQVLLTVTRNGRKQYNQLCANDNSKQEFMDNLTCLAPENLEQLHQCMDGSIARFEYVANRVEADNRISAICCSYQIFKRDIQETVEKTCSKFNNVNQTAHYLHEIISTTTGELIDLVCGSYKTFEECKAKPKMAALVSTFTDITLKTKKKQIQPRAKSLISLFVGILNSF